MSNRNETLKMIEKVKNGLHIYHGYELGKMPNEYLMGQKNSPLAAFHYYDLKVSLFVDANARVEIPGQETILYEKDLDAQTRKEVREGLIAFQHHNYFYFDADEYIQPIYQHDIESIPTKLDMKMKFIHDIIDTLRVKEMDVEAEQLSGFKLVQKVVPEKSRKSIGILPFRERVQNLIKTEDLFDHVEIVEVDFTFNLYDANVHYELLYYTDNPEAEKYICSAFDGLFV